MRLLGLAALLAALALPASAGAAEWVAGDGHVHTCHSHDSWCPGEDPAAETLYSSFATVAQRFAEASAKDLDFLVVSDHDTVGAWTDPGFNTAGVIGVHAYENTVDGGSHAHMIGAQRLYEEHDADPAAAADALNADGGLFQANHPSYREPQPITGCEDVEASDPRMHWKLGFTVRPDSIEVWNPTALIRPAEVFWECWLQRGVRVPALGGSDSHGAQQANLGMPTTWVLAEERSEAAILAAIRAGRTTISRLPPSAGGARLVLEADADRDGTFEKTIGDTVPPGVPARARVEGLSAPGLLRVRGAGAGQPAMLLQETPILPGQSVPVRLPASLEGGWVRAVIVQQSLSADVDPNCTSPHPSAPLSFCTADLAHSAMTSPLYVATPAAVEPAGKKPKRPKAPKAPAGTTTAEPDDDAPLPPARQSEYGASLPAIP